MWPAPKLIASLLTWRGWNARVIRAGTRLHTGLLRRFRRAKLIGDDALILATRGRKTGKETSTLLFYARDADRLLIAASFAGSGVLPGWYLNLVAQPDVQATINGRTERYRARTLSDAEAEAAWPKLLAVYPTFSRYRRRARRTKPVGELRHSVGDASPPLM
jgi:deazaflavin-dependent oxidoreductase (nitroreductase family)